MYQREEDDFAEQLANASAKEAKEAAAPPVKRQMERELIAYHHQCGISIYSRHDRLVRRRHLHLPSSLLPACLLYASGERSKSKRARDADDN